MSRIDRTIINGQQIGRMSEKNFIKHFKDFLKENTDISEGAIQNQNIGQLVSRLYKDKNADGQKKWSRMKSVKIAKFLYIDGTITKENLEFYGEKVIELQMIQKKNQEGRSKITQEKALGYEHRLVLGNQTSKSFYSSEEWKALRYRAFDLYGNMCLCCGRRPKDGIVLHVDHIVPRVLSPEKALDIKNLEILCNLCNEGKRADYITDWR